MSDIRDPPRSHIQTHSKWGNVGSRRQVIDLQKGKRGEKRSEEKRSEEQRICYVVEERGRKRNENKRRRRRRRRKRLRRERS